MPGDGERCLAIAAVGLVVRRQFLVRPVPWVLKRSRVRLSVVFRRASAGRYGERAAVVHRELLSLLSGGVMVPALGSNGGLDCPQRGRRGDKVGRCRAVARRRGTAGF